MPDRSVNATLRRGAQLLLSLSTWAVDADHDPRRDPYGALSKGPDAILTRRYDLTVVGVSNGGWIEVGSKVVTRFGRVHMKRPYFYCSRSGKATVRWTGWRRTSRRPKSGAASVPERRATVPSYLSG